jgi:hypothetical protein
LYTRLSTLLTLYALTVTVQAQNSNKTANITEEV